MPDRMTAADWPALPLDAWRDTRDTLHMWTQIVGKIRLALTPLVNHWWNVTLYVTAHGLGTGAMPCGGREIEILFDFVDHNLWIRSSDGQEKVIPLIPRSVADFYREVTSAMKAMGVDVPIWTTPVEVSRPIPFDQDTQHAAYDPEYANRFWRVLVLTDQVFEQFRARFIGKCSPVHFFWGSFDLAVTRFSGRRAPERPGADPITREAYSHEVISHGFWPGGDWMGNEVPTPIYYSYTAPAPSGLGEEPVRPSLARYDPNMGEFLLDYEAVRTAAAPRPTLLDFCQSTYEAGARRANWDRGALDRAAA